MSGSCIENKVVVKILGEEYPITSTSDPAHMLRVAAYVDRKMREAARLSRSKARDKIAILAALSIASELCLSSDQLKDLEDNQDTRVDNLLSRLDASLSGERSL